MVMFTNQRMHRWLSVLLLLALVAGLLPMRSVSAADQEIVIPKEVVDIMVYQTLWQQAYQGNDAVTAVIYDMFILQAGQAGMSEADLTRVIGILKDKVDNVRQNAMQSAAQGQGPTNDAQPSMKKVAQTVIEAALTVPELQPYIKKVWQSFAGPLGLPTGLDQASKVARGSGGAFTNPQLQGLIRDTIAQVVSASQTNVAVASGCDKVHQKKVKVSVKKFDGGKTAKETPNLGIPPELIQNIQLNGTINVTLNQLKDLSQTEFNNIHLSLDDMRQTLVQIDQKQDVIIDYINNQQEQVAMQALAAAKAAEHQIKLAAFQSSLFVVSTLANFIDPKLGKELNTVATAALQIGEALNGWLDAVAGLSALEKIGSLSTVVMTGNVLGAVMNVISLFGESAPSPEQIILQEIGKLRQQVDQLRTEMHDRFDRIDQELNTIYTTMQDRFDKIDIQLGKLNANILTVQRTLIDLDNKLSRIERNNFELLDALGRRPLLEAINGGLGYQERTGQAMPFQPDFVTYENIFQSWGTIHAFDALATGPSQRNFSDGALLAELNAFPMDANLNYLNGWLKVRGLPAIANNRLASPRDWLFASRAYSQLAVEWPEYIKQIDPQRQVALNAVGADLEAAMRNLATQITAADTTGNSLIFSQVITNYNGKLNALNNAIAGIENSYVQEVQTNRLQRQPPFDLYGGVDQTLAYQAPELSQMSCGGLDPALATPVLVKSQLPNFNRYNLAEYFGQGALRACVFGKLLRPQRVCPPGQDACDTSGDMEVSVTVFFHHKALNTSTTLNRQTMVFGNATIKADDDATSYVIRHWPFYAAVFDTRAISDVPTPAQAAQRAALLATITTALHDQFAAYQRELAGRVLNELAVGSLRPLAGELAGSKALLNSFVTIGLQRAVSNDDFFHAMLYGDQQLVEDSQLLATYTLSATQPVTATQITVNPRLLVKATAEQRTTVFTGMVDHYLDAMRAQTHVEAFDYIADTRRELDLALRIARLAGATAPPTGNRLYLPVVQR